MSIKDRLSPAGEEWEFDVTIHTLKEHRDEKNEKRRFTIAISVLCGIALGVTTLGIFGLWARDFSAVSGFWTAAGPAFGAIIGYYFAQSSEKK